VDVPVALTADDRLVSPRLLWPRLSQILREQSTAADLGSLAGLVRPAWLDVPFNVGVASGSITPNFAATAPMPGREEIGLLGPVTVRLSLQRVVTVTVQTDAALLLTEQNAVGGLKKSGGWAPFDSQAFVAISNPSSSFYVVGWVYAPLWYMRRALFDALKRELRALLPAPDAEATGVV
jgi:hypothetical protein